MTVMSAIYQASTWLTLITCLRWKRLLNWSPSSLCVVSKRAELPYQKVYDVRQRNSRLGLGLMGMHEWLLKRGYKYEVNDELKTWLKVYRKQSDKTAKRGG